MDFIGVLGIFLFFISFTLFFWLNIRFLAHQFNKVKTQLVMEGRSILEQIRSFSLTEKNLYSLNIISAVIFALFGIYFRMGVFGPLVGAVLGWILPSFLVKYYKKKYFKKIEKQLIAVLDLLTNAMKAGESLPQAIEGNIDVLGYPISQELGIITRQVKMGVPMIAALNGLAERVPSMDVKLITQAMGISINTGANLPVALEKIATTIRQRNLIQGKIKALTTQGKAQGIVVGVLPIALGGFLYFMDPDYIGILFNTFGGNCVIALMVVLEIIAFVVIKKIVTIRI